MAIKLPQIITSEGNRLSGATFVKLTNIYNKLTKGNGIANPPKIKVYNGYEGSPPLAYSPVNETIFITHDVIKNSSDKELTVKIGHELGHWVGMHGAVKGSGSKIKELLDSIKGLLSLRSKEHEADRIAVHLTGDKSLLNKYRQIAMSEEIYNGIPKDDGLVTGAIKKMDKFVANRFVYGTPKQIEKNIMQGADAMGRQHVDNLIAQRNAGYTDRTVGLVDGMQRALEMQKSKTIANTKDGMDVMVGGFTAKLKKSTEQAKRFKEEMEQLGGFAK